MLMTAFCVSLFFNPLINMGMKLKRAFDRTKLENDGFMNKFLHESPNDDKQMDQETVMGGSDDLVVKLHVKARVFSRFIFLDSLFHILDEFGHSLDFVFSRFLNGQFSCANFKKTPGFKEFKSGLLI